MIRGEVIEDKMFVFVYGVGIQYDDPELFAGI